MSSNRAVYFERGTYGSRRGLRKPTTAMLQGDAYLLHHIIFNNTNLYTGLSFTTEENQGKVQERSWAKLRIASDEVCRKNKLSTIPFAEANKGVSHLEWEQQQKAVTSWKAKLRYEIDCIIQRCDTFQDFLEKCRLNDIEAVYTPEKKVSLKFRMKGQQRFTRAKTLGEYYMPDSIKERSKFAISRRKNATVTPTSTIIDRNKIDSKCFQHWADIQNMKNVAKMINMFESYNVHSTKEIKLTAMSAMARRGMLTQSINNANKKLADFSEQIELVRTFLRTKPCHTGNFRQ